MHTRVMTVMVIIGMLILVLRRKIMRMMISVVRVVGLLRLVMLLLMLLLRSHEMMASIIAIHLWHRFSTARWHSFLCFFGGVVTQSRVNSTFVVVVVVVGESFREMERRCQNATSASECPFRLPQDS